MAVIVRLNFCGSLKSWTIGEYIESCDNGMSVCVQRVWFVLTA